MALSLICACGARFEVEDTLAGQDVSCPECQQSLKAPALRQPSRRTSDLALSSFVLSLVGAVTVIGTIAAVLLGALALFRIRRNRDRIAGTGFAIWGILNGSVFTVLTLLALSSSELFGLGGMMRRNMLGDKVDTAGELTLEDATAGFRITRPSRQWGVSTADRLEDPFLNLLQGPNARKLDLLLVQTQRDICVDIRSERRLIGNIDLVLDEVVGDLTPSPAVDQFEAKGRRDVDGNLFRITKVTASGSSKRLETDAGIDAREKEVIVVSTVKTCKMWLRVYYNGDRLFVVRAYGPKTSFDHGEQELRKLLDSFKILAGR